MSFSPAITFSIKVIIRLHLKQVVFCASASSDRSVTKGILNAIMTCSISPKIFKEPSLSYLKFEHCLNFFFHSYVIKDGKLYFIQFIVNNFSFLETFSKLTNYILINSLFTALEMLSSNLIPIHYVF